MDKNTIRQEMLKKRRALDADFVSRVRNSEAVSSSVMKLVREAAAAVNAGDDKTAVNAGDGAAAGSDRTVTVMSYESFNNEFPTENINRLLTDSGFRLVLPYTDANFRVIPLDAAKTAQFHTSKLGIREPLPDKDNIVPTDEIDIFLVPGVAFGRDGSRIGFGKGCYDRLLPEKKTGALTAALAFEFQILPSLPHDVHDVFCDCIVSESGIIYCMK